MRRFRTKRWGITKEYRALLRGLRGLEIGGPSDILGFGGSLPLYSCLGETDNCNFNEETIWSSDAFKYARTFVLDGTALKIESGSYDCVIASHCLEHIANPIKALLEWKRVLRPGGLLLLILPHRDHTFDWRRPVTPFNPLHQNQRPALLYQGGQVYIGWGSHCDLTSQHAGPSWYGWLMSYKLTGSSFGSGPTGAWLTSSNPEAGIWQSGSGPAGDGTNLYFGTGNGSTTAAPNGSACAGCYGNSIVKLNGTPSSGTFTVLDSFTPYDHPYRFCDDGDMGSGGLVLLQGTGLTPSNLIVQSGKEGNIYMLNSNTGSMGGYGGTTGTFNCPVTSTGTDNIVQAIYGDLCTAAQGDPECGLQGSPVFWSNSGSLNVFFGPRCQPIKQYSLQGPNAALSFANETIAGGTTNSSCPSSTNPVFPYPGASLAISQYSASGAILWALQTDNSCLSHAPQAPILYAYDAANVGTAAALFSSSAGTGCAVRFTIPTVVNGHVYIGNGGQLVVFH